MNNRWKLLLASLIAFLALGSCLHTGHYVFAQTDQTSFKIQAADTAIEQAFNAVLHAEKAGANVTELLSQLKIGCNISEKGKILLRLQ